VSAATDGALPETLPALLMRAARERPRGVALRQKRLGIWEETSWSDYLAGVRDVALSLHELGLGVGDRVAIVADNSPEWLFADLGIQSVGALSIGVYPTNPAEDVEYILDHAEIRVVFCGDQEQVDKVLEVRERLPALERVVAFDMKGMLGYDEGLLEPFESFAARGRELAEREPGLFERLLYERDPEEAAIVGYTSGTTGKPKGAMLRHASQVEMARILCEWVGLSESDRDFCHFPLVHPAARMVDAYSSLVGGSSVNLPEELETVMEDMVEIAPTLLLGTPRVFERMKADVEIRAERAVWLKRVCYRRGMRWLSETLERQLAGEPRAGDRLRRFAGHWLIGRWVLDKLGMLRLSYVSCGGASVAPELLKFFWALGVPVHETYGQSETSGFAFAQRGYDDIGTAGHPLPTFEARISDRGELLLKGAGIFAGYLRDPEQTEAAFDDGWYRTGDVGRLDGDGRLVVSERQKHVIRTASGQELSPSEIENKLKVSPYVSDAMVVAEDRPFATALIQIELDVVSDWAQRRNLPYTHFRSLTELSQVIELVEGQVKQTNLYLPEEKQVRDFRLFPRELDPDDDEVTPTRKIKRNVVSERFGALIEEMYGSERVAAGAREPAAG
jgi:long-chain acyl-CoA synthetase